MRTRIATAALGLAVVAGCGYEGANSLPLPGAVGGKDTYTVTITFKDATNLVPKETCRTNSTVVGSVASVELNDELQAEVVCRIKNSVQIPGNAVATLRETSLLGERFVGLDVPPGVKAAGRLAPGTRIPASETLAHPDTEIVLGALSQVLNGGSLGSIATISRELITALDGRTDTARRTSQRLASTLKSFNDNRQNLLDTLDELDRFSATLAKQRGVIAATLEEVPDGLAVLDRQRPRLTAALKRLDRLSDTVVPLIEQSKDDTVADLKHLKPVLSELAKTGDSLTLSLERLTSFPFNGNTAYTIKGDYSGSYIFANIDLDSINTLLLDLLDQDTSVPGTPGIYPLPTLPGLPALPSLPGLPTLPGLPSAPSAPSGQASAPGLPDLPGLGGLLGGGR